MIAAGFDWNQPYSCTSWGSTFGLTYPILDDTPNIVWNMYGMGYIPHNVVIDHTMTVRYTASGFNQTAITNTIQTYLDLLPNDVDGDGYSDDADNCPEIYNPGQEDVDDDGMGDVCDPCDNANVFIPGNLNGDLSNDVPIIDIFDVLVLMNLILAQNFSGCSGEAANFYNDANINVLDAIYLVNYIMNGGVTRSDVTELEQGVKVELRDNQNSTEVVFSDAQNMSGIQFVLPNVLIDEISAESIIIPDGWVLRSRTIENRTLFLLIDLTGRNSQSYISLNLPVRISHEMDDLIISNSNGQLLKPIVESKHGSESTVDLQPMEFTGLYPNPFNPTVTIPFVLAEAMKTRISVYNIRGQEIDVLQNGILEAGQHLTTWQADEFPSGIYFIQIEAAGITRTHKALLMK